MEEKRAENSRFKRQQADMKRKTREYFMLITHAYYKYM